MKLSNKGAVFGVDARITVIIFTSILLVSGYIVTSKIEMAQKVSILNNFKNISKAINELELDSKTFYPNILLNPNNGGTAFLTLYKNDYIKPPYKAIWRGPYYKTITSDNKDKKYGFYNIVFGDENINPCNLESACFSWVSLSNVPSKLAIGVKNYYNDDSKDVKNPKIIIKEPDLDYSTIYFKASSKRY